MNELRHALRSLRRRPGFAAVVILTLALGVGATTAIFSVIHAVLLRSLPYREPERLVQVRWLWKAGDADGVDALTATEYIFWKEHSQSFERVAAFARPGAGFNLVALGEPAYVRGELISADLFPALGVGPMLGRGFLPEEDRPGGPPVAILSHALWRQRFVSDPNLIGQQVSINGTNHTVVGVMPPAFRFGGSTADIWLPLRLVADPRDNGHNTLTIARLKPGVSLALAQAEMPRLLEAFRQEFPRHEPSANQAAVLLRPYHELLVAEVRPSLLLLFGAAGLVLLIAMANAAGLFVGRTVGRSQEIAVRAALGGSRWALLRPALAESVILSLAGSAGGLLLAGWTLDALLGLARGVLPFADDVRLNLPVLLTAIGVSVLTGVVVAVLPALRSLRGAVHPSLQDAERSLGGARQRGRSLLVATEIALSTVLLVGAGLLIASLAELWGVQPGFEPARLWAVQMSLPADKYRITEQVWRFESQVMARFAALPGVSAVATTSSLPLELGLNSGLVGLRGGERVRAYIEGRVVSPGYFQALGIPVLTGRGFTDADGRDAARVVVINERLARHLWPEAAAIGQQVDLYALGGGLAEVVGVVRDVREYGLNAPPPQTVYLPVAQMSDGFLRTVNGWFLTSWLIKTPAPLDLATVRRAVAEVDPTQPVVNLRAMTEVISGWLAPWRFVGALLNVFAGLALLLALIGVYGIVSYSVSRRTREIGLRAALGATRGGLVGLVLGQGAGLALGGVVVGLAAAVGLTRFLRGMLFGVQPADPVVLVAAGLTLGAVALLASWLPARRAAKIDPMAALRIE